MGTTNLDSGFVSSLRGFPTYDPNRRTYRRGFTEIISAVISALGYLPLWDNSEFYLRVRSLPGVIVKPLFGPSLYSTECDPNSHAQATCIPTRPLSSISFSSSSKADATPGLQLPLQRACDRTYYDPNSHAQATRIPTRPLLHILLLLLLGT